MFRRLRRREQPRAEVREAFDRFRACLTHVESAKSSLAAAAPRGRTGGIPLARALVEFESGLALARSAMPGWRIAEVEEAWRACERALTEASRRAEALRLGEAPKGYEQLYGRLGDVLEPLDAFAVGVDRFRRLGR